MDYWGPKDGCNLQLVLLRFRMKLSNGDVSKVQLSKEISSNLVGKARVYEAALSVCAVPSH